MRFNRKKLGVGITVVLSLGFLFLSIGIVIEQRAIAGRDPCRGRLKQIASALNDYARYRGSFPPGTQQGASLRPEQRISWVPLIINWTDHYQAVTFRFQFDRPWDSPENVRPLLEISPAGDPSYSEVSSKPAWFPMRCRSNPYGITPGMPDPLDYVGIAGLGTDAPTLPNGHRRAGVFGYDRQTRLEDIKDGLSNTMTLAETTAGVGPWTAGGFTTVRGLDPARPSYVGRGRQFGGVHRGGAMVAFADGSVRFLRESIAPDVFEAMSTVAGGEPPSTGWDW